MQLDQLRSCLDSHDAARHLLYDWDVRNFERGRGNLAQLAEAIGLDALGELCHPLSRLLPRCADPDMALNNLERFLVAPAAAEQLPALLEGRARTLETLLQLFSTSQFFSDLLVANPDYLDMLRIPLRSSPSRSEMLAQLQGEIDDAPDDATVLRALRR